MKDNEIEDSEHMAEAFAINSEDRANWLLRKLANLEAEEARIKAQADAMLQQVKSDRQSLMFRFGAELEAFARQAIEEKGGKRKSVTLLQGTLAFRSQPARVVIESMEDAITTARVVCPEAIEQVEKFNQTAYRDYAQRRLEETGELLPGVAMEEAKDVFGVRFPKAGKEGEE